VDSIVNILQEQARMEEQAQVQERKPDEVAQIVITMRDHPQTILRFGDLKKARSQYLSITKEWKKFMRAPADHWSKHVCVDHDMYTAWFFMRDIVTLNFVDWKKYDKFKPR
jgi:PhoPQ-activated pathogenicity-related protein